MNEYQDIRIKELKDERKLQGFTRLTKSFQAA